MFLEIFIHLLFIIIYIKYYLIYFSITCYFNYERAIGQSKIGHFSSETNWNSKTILIHIFFHFNLCMYVCICRYHVLLLKETLEQLKLVSFFTLAVKWNPTSITVFSVGEAWDRANFKCLDFAVAILSFYYFILNWIDLQDL